MTSQVETTNHVEIKNELLDNEPSVTNGDGDLNGEDQQEFFDPRDVFIKLNGCSFNETRLIKSAIEEIILKKIRSFERIDKSKVSHNERSVYYLKDYAIDKVGNSVIVGETGIAEGWNVPLYKNEFSNLLGLPFTEDHALAETLRIKRPRQECFNCLATNHRVQECPVRVDEERINIHRSLFNSQSHQAQEQMSLYSNRYTNDLDSKTNRGFVPGKCSEQLREALGVKANQLPPFVYLMRKFGYPTGWLLEAQVVRAKLAVHDGDKVQDTADSVPKSTPSEDGIVNDDEPAKVVAEEDPSIVEYDPSRIYSFPGFNEPPPANCTDESEKYGVRRYCTDFSKEKFLTTLRLEKKKIIRRTLSESKSQLDVTSGDEEDVADKNDAETEARAANEKDEVVTSEEEEGGEANEEGEFASPKRRKTTMSKQSELGASFSEIPGTPIVNNMSGISHTPNWEKFAENICEHKPFEMNLQTPTGSYKNIVKLTRDFKSASKD